jgi:hypothetical protein
MINSNAVNNADTSNQKAKKAKGPSPKKTVIPEDSTDMKHNSESEESLDSVHESEDEKSDSDSGDSRDEKENKETSEVSIAEAVGKKIHRKRRLISMVHL